MPPGKLCNDPLCAASFPCAHIGVAQAVGRRARPSSASKARTRGGWTPGLMLPYGRG